MSQPRIAIVHHWMVTLGGGERVLEAMARLFPEADLFTLLHDPRAFSGTALAGREVHTSFLQRMPLARRQHRLFLPLMPLAVERLDLHAYDIVLSSSSAMAHGARARPGARHVCYIHAPMRYAWAPETSLAHWGLGRGPLAWGLRLALGALRRWDRAASTRVDDYIANSRYTAQNVRRYYGREAEVIYPPVRTGLFRPANTRDDTYITLSRLVPYKRVDLIVEAFNRLGKPLVVVGDGPARQRLQRLAEPNVRFVTDAPDAEVARLLGRARAFVFAAEEEFGISVVEAQAAGCPVIAYGAGGVLETVVDGQTGLFYGEQSVEGVMAGVAAFEARADDFSAAAIRENALKFDERIFEAVLARRISGLWEEFRVGDIDNV